MGGTNETLFGDLRVARRFRVRSATASAAGCDQPAASSARSPTAAEVTLGGSHWSERMEKRVVIRLCSTKIKVGEHVDIITWKQTSRFRCSCRALRLMSGGKQPIC